MSTPPAPTKLSLSASLAAFFDPRASTLVPDVDNDSYKTFAFGSVISDADLCRVCGVPSKSTLTLAYVPARNDPNDELTPQGIFVKVDNAKFFDHPMELIIYRKPDDTIGIYVKLVVLRKHPTLASVGALILESMGRAADAPSKRRPKISEFTMLAAGGRTWPPMIGTARWDGFAVWPRYGFDMPLRTKTRAMFAHFPHVPPVIAAGAACANVAGLLSLTKGLEFWDLVGDGWYMHFHAAKGSDSRNRLSQYLRNKYL